MHATSSEDSNSMNGMDRELVHNHAGVVSIDCEGVMDLSDLEL